MGWMVWGSNADEDEIFRTPSDRPWGPPNLLHIGYGVSFPGVKWPQRSAKHPPPFRAEVKKRLRVTPLLSSRLSWLIVG